MKIKKNQKVKKIKSKSRMNLDDPLDWMALDEDSIYHRAYLEGLERDLSLGFPRYQSRSD